MQMLIRGLIYIAVTSVQPSFEANRIPTGIPGQMIVYNQFQRCTRPIAEGHAYFIRQILGASLKSLLLLLALELYGRR